MKKTSELLAESAGPFDTACMMVRDMEQELEWLRKFRPLYEAVNEMVTYLGMGGEIDARHKTVDAVMNALHALAGGAPLPPEACDS